MKTRIDHLVVVAQTLNHELEVPIATDVCSRASSVGVNQYTIVAPALSAAPQTEVAPELSAAPQKATAEIAENGCA